MVRIPTLKTVENFKKLLRELQVEMPCDE
ncbi:MAG: hypothetical protein JWO95_3062, partial [Verrucomicrobiales bacterium]|nr:hypothetical protein [Verrucomicrobiales bacterium]